MKVLENIYKKLKNKIKSIPTSCWFISVAAFILLLPLLEGKIVYGHDSYFHITNVYNAYSFIGDFDFNIFTSKIWGNGIANDFGYGTPIFYPPLYYVLGGFIANILKIFESTSYTMILLNTIIILGSGLTMNKLLLRLFKDDSVSFLGSLAYICTPYFLSDIYVRDSVGESFMFVFIPLIILGIYELLKDNPKKFYIYFIIGYCGIILSHLVLSVYLTIFLIIVLLFNYKKVFKLKTFKHLVFASLNILLLTSPFTIPLLEHTILGDYVVYNEEIMFSFFDGEMRNLSEFFIIDNSYIRYYFNYIVLGLAVFALLYGKKFLKEEHLKIVRLASIFVIISILACTNYALWEVIPTFLKMIQFPWRLCTFITFAMALIASTSVMYFKGETKTLLMIFATSLMLYFGYTSINTYHLSQAALLNQKYLGHQNEYLPTKTNDNIKYYNERTKEIYVTSGSADITITKDETPRLEAIIDLKSTSATLELPRLYYLGYKIILKTDDTKETLKYRESDYGFIEVDIPSSGTLEISYSGTLLNKVAGVISILTISTNMVLIFYFKNKKKTS